MSNSDSQPLSISVIIPAYNAACWIGETLDSVLAQTYPILEVLVVDDGSTDDTAAVVRGYGGRVRLIQKVNGGDTSARNVGIRQAQGEWLAFVDADDLWLPRKLERQVACLVEKKVSWVICDVEHFDDRSGQEVKNNRMLLHEGDVLEALFLRNFIASPTPLIHKNVFEQVGLFSENTEYNYAMDWEMWMRIALHYPLGVVWQVLARRRVHSSSLTNTLSRAHRFRSAEFYTQRIVELAPGRLKPLEPRVHARRLFVQVVLLTKEKNFTQAKAWLIESLKIEPWNPKGWTYALLLLPGEPVTAWLYTLIGKIKSSG